MIPYGRQDISNDDVNAVLEVLQSDFLTQGPAVPAFEDKIKNYCGVKNAVAVNSATSALHIACLALDVGPGDRVWTSPITFVASSNCALYCGATVDFVDTDPRTHNISVNALHSKLKEAEKNGVLPKVVIPVHLTGQSCEMAEVYALSKRYGFKIIEDASHAIGGKFLGEPIGNCAFSDITVFSFHPVKIITTCEGGLATTNNSDVAQKLRLLRSHGITRDENQMVNISHGSWYYEQILLGFNYRMTDIQAALGVSQMDRLDQFVTKRHELADRYNQLLKHLPLVLPWQNEDSYSAFHLYVVKYESINGGRSFKEVFEFIRGEGVGINLHYMPVYKQPYYKRLGFSENYCAEAERYYQSALSLPMYSGLTVEDQDKVVDVLGRIFR
ncbi:UDP-4-amino-4,6-dideoxy-N-acetyl-beta-L-altrosamine transaminase [Pseudomonadales bacterium]|nr:UDP-4-amino-4,6-dideoxy-N-acetyl-beta-L-altrosamine transaminase [Pseudomonadales bacterium]